METPTDASHSASLTVIRAFSTTPAAASAREIVFVDLQVPDLPCLVAGLKSSAALVVLWPDRDGVQQIADALTALALRDVHALHIVAHGGPGGISLGRSTLCTASMAQHAARLAQVGAALAPDAAILLWACETGRGRQGAAFLKALSEATGANIAAATHRVGSAAHGGT